MTKKKTVRKTNINGEKSIKPRKVSSDAVVDEDQQVDDVERYDGNGVKSEVDMERARNDTDIERF